jgi:AcrR family transcriptional regulator
VASGLPKERKLRDRFRQETASAVLAAAEEVFAEKGLHGASMNEIARRAGVAVGTLYNHFADREALLSHLLEMRCRELLQAVDGELKQTRNFHDQLVALVSTFFSSKEKHRALFLLVTQEEKARGSSDEIKREVYRRVDKLVKRGVKEGLLRERDADLYASLLMGMLRGVMMREHYGAPLTPLAECVHPLVDFFLWGARRK